MNYKIPDAKLQELNLIVGNQGGPATSKVSDSFAALEVAIKTGNKADAQTSFNAAVEANKLDGAAWANVQQWHDQVKNEYQEGDDGGRDPDGGLPAIPANAIEMRPGGDGHLMTADGKDVTIKGKNYAAYVTGGSGSSGRVYYFKATYDAGMASLSCDGKKIAFTVTDQPSDPGEPYNGNTASANGYRKGQCCNFRIGEGGYHNDTMVIFSVN